MVASHHGAPGRGVWTVVGSWLASYWLAPFSVAEAVLGTKMRRRHRDVPALRPDGRHRASRSIIVFNANLLATLFQRRNATRSIAAGVHRFARRQCNRGGGGGQPPVTAQAQCCTSCAGAGGPGGRCRVGFDAVPGGRAGAQDGRRVPAGQPLPHRHDHRHVLTDRVLANRGLQRGERQLQATVTGSNGDGGWNVVTTANRNNPVGDVSEALRASGRSRRRLDCIGAGRTTTFIGDRSKCMHDGIVGATSTR